VLAAQAGDGDTAERLLLRAVAVNPNYAEAWQNLGALRRSSGGIHDLLLAESDLARAARLDRSLRGTRPVLTMDRHVYVSGLDVSKPVPPTWQYSEQASDPALPLTLTMLLALLARLAWAVGLERVTGRLSERALQGRGRGGVLFGPWPSAVGLAAAVLVLAIRPVTGADSSWLVLVLVLALTGVASAPVVVHRLVARRATGHVRTDYTWGPTVAVAAVGAPFGILFTPLPVVNDALGGTSTTVRRAGLATALAVALTLSAVAVLSAGPGIRLAAVAALGVAASVALPMPPFDGSAVRSRLVNSMVTAGLLATTVAVTLNWL
jgi:hypothetical protein